MVTTAQMNTRIDPDIKRRGDAVFARAGLTSSQVVRAVWKTAAETQQIPDCVQSLMPNQQERELKLARVRQACHVFEQFCAEQGLPLTPTTHVDDYQQLRDQMYDQLSSEMEARHA